MFKVREVKLIKVDLNNGQEVLVNTRNIDMVDSSAQTNLIRLKNNHTLEIKQTKEDVHRLITQGGIYDTDRIYSVY